MPPPKLHPAVTGALLLVLNVGARAAAKAFDSVLKDAGEAFDKGSKKVKKARGNLRKKVRESRAAAGFEDSWKPSHGRRTPANEEEE